jgi:hypothetical protein
MKKSELKQIIKEEISMVFLNRINKNKSLKVGDITTISQGKYKGKKVKIVKDLGNGNFELESVKEEISKTLNENSEKYMFFQNLETIKKEVEEMLSLDPQMVDAILANGHDWAADHISTSKDDIEEVHNFLMSNKAPMDEKKLSAKQMKIAKAAPPEDKITGADFAALRKGK